jgi:adenosine deaminase
MTIQEFINKAPKAELHNHIDGGLRVETIIEIAKKENVNIPSFSKIELQSLLTNDENCTDLLDYFKPFETTISVMQSEASLERIMFEFLEDRAAENIKYIEARFSPALHLQKGLTYHQVMDAILRGKKQAESQYDIQCNLIVCGLRQNNIATNIEMAKLAIRYKKQGVIAYDLAGEEFGRPAKNHIPAFQIAIDNNLFRTVHAGEADGSHSIADAVHYLGAQRIGHGTHLYEDTELLEFIRDRQIGLEVCLSSNLQTKSVSDISKHPIKNYFLKNIPVTINTDSNLISGTTLTQEFVLAYKHFQFNLDDIQELMLNAYRQAFLPFDKKKSLLESAKNEILALKKVFFSSN